MIDFHSKLTVVDLSDGQISVTVIIPAELLSEWSSLASAASEFCRKSRRLAAISRAASPAPSLLSERDKEKNVKDYHALLSRLHSDAISQGLGRADALSFICRRLKEQNHPWRERSLVARELKAVKSSLSLGGAI